MALTISLPSARAAVVAPVRASASSGTNPVSVNFVSVSGTQLLSRLDALRTRTKETERPCSACGPMHLHPESHPSLAQDDRATSNFGDCHARLENWWKEHLEDKAALVHAACPDFAEAGPADEEEDTTVFTRHPVSTDRYPAQQYLYHF